MRELEKTIPTTELPEGTVYQVQMGFYQYLDLVSFNDKLKTVRAEEIDGKKRYVIGHFDNLLDASLLPQLFLNVESIALPNK